MFCSLFFDSYYHLSLRAKKFVLFLLLFLLLLLPLMLILPLLGFQILQFPKSLSQSSLLLPELSDGLLQIDVDDGIDDNDCKRRRRGVVFVVVIFVGVVAKECLDQCSLNVPS